MLNQNVPNPTDAESGQIAVSGLADLIALLPDGLYFAAAVFCVAGVVVWLAGRRFVRPGLTILGLAIGSSAGLVVSAFLPSDISMWWTIIGGGVFFALIAFAVYRMIMAVFLAAALGLAGPIAFYNITEIQGVYAGEPVADLAVEDLLIPGLDRTVGDLKPDIPDIPESASDEVMKQIDDLMTESFGEDNPVSDLIEQATGGDSDSNENAEPGDAVAEGAGTDGDEAAGEQPSFRAHLSETVDFLIETAQTRWADAPFRQKRGIVASGIIGTGVGLVCGLLLPGIAASLVTALMGSAVFLPSGGVLACRAFGFSPDRIYEFPILVVLTIWLITAVGGFAIQLRIGDAKADKKGT